MNISPQVRRDELRSEIIRAARVLRDATQVIIEESDDEDALNALDRLNRALENFAMWTYEQLPASARAGDDS